MIRQIIPLLMLFAIACGKKDKPTDSGLVETPAPVEEPALPVHPDPGPAMKRLTGALEPVMHPVAEVKADRWQKGDGYVLATIPLSDEVPALQNRNASWVVEANDQHGSAFSWWGKNLADPKLNLSGFIVRIRGDALPSSFTVRWAQDHGDYGADRKGGAMGSFNVTVPANLPEVKGLDQEFWFSAQRGFERSGRGPDFATYAGQRARFLAAGADVRNLGQQRRGRRSDIHEMMEIFSGMTSINEALQADRGLFIRAEELSERKVPIAEVERLSLPEHPWDSMIADLGVKPVVEPLAAYAPADMAYLHFGDLRTFLKLIHDLDGWVSPVGQWFEYTNGTSHFMSRYEEQLVLERTGLADKLGHIAAKDVAVLVGDTFLREGTDISMLFRVANREALVGAFGLFEARSRARHTNMKRTTSTVDGVEVQRLSTPDGAVNQYRAEYGDVMAISNSYEAMQRLIRAHKGTVPRLSEQGDFRYMRAVYPWRADAAAKDGFLFLGDAFVARVVSPEVKILESRRMDARADLQAINYAALLRGWIDGERTTSVQDLVSAGYVRPEELKHIDLTPISFTEEAAAQSDYGSVSRLAPIRAHEPTLDKVSPNEKEAYDRFRQSYQSYWRGYLDPIAARVERSEDGKAISIDARMLPLIDVSEYDELLREVGTQKILGPEVGPGLQWTLAIGKDARLRRELDGMAKGFIPGDNIGISWLGDWVSVGVADRGGLWDMGLITGMVPGLEETQTDLFRGLEVLSTFPIYATVHISNTLGLAALLTGLKSWVNDAAPGMVSWGQGEPYRDIPIVTIAQGSGVPREFENLTIHYATVEDVFMIAFNRETLLGLIDRGLAGQMPSVHTGPASTAAPDDAQAVLNVNPGPSGWIAKTILGIGETTLITKHGAVMDAYEAIWRGLGDGSALSPEDVRKLGVAYLGYEPRSPHGGSFSIADGFATHSIYGDLVRPVMPAVPIPGSPITDVVERLARLRMTVESEGEGDHRGLHTTVKWQWR